MSSHLEFGKHAEVRAEAYLQGLGYTVLDKNIRFKFGEIDLLVTDGTDLIFVEVRARKVGSLQSPLESLSFSKIQRLKRSMRAVLASQSVAFQGVRLDVLAWEGTVWKHYPHVLLEGLF